MRETVDPWVPLATGTPLGPWEKGAAVEPPPRADKEQSPKARRKAEHEEVAGEVVTRYHNDWEKKLRSHHQKEENTTIPRGTAVLTIAATRILLRIRLARHCERPCCVGKILHVEVAKATLLLPSPTL